MTSIHYSVAAEVFAKFPDFVRGVVIAEDVHNGPTPVELTAMLREAEESVRQRIGESDIAAHPRIASWREAYRSLGIKPNEFRCSVEAMARRALRRQEIPAINTLVDIGNVLSLRHLLPMGGHGLDDVRGDIALRPADGSEEFIPFGSDQVEHPAPGEIVFVEGNIVLTRRWSWRQANHTLTLPQTTFIEYNVEGLPPVTPAEVEQVCREVMELVARFCGGTQRYEILSRHNPRIRVR